MKQTILITGGSGFLGRRLARRLMGEHDVVLASRNNKMNRLSEDLTGCQAIPLDVTNIESIRDAFNEFKPQVVIHAAATKFVDLAERQPCECVDVNVLGSENVARVAMERGVEAVVGISTDKAAPPVRNTYGLSKALMERMFCGLDGKTSTRFACVRYGNVAWSTGSVLPIWRRMFKERGLIGTTGPEMRRFFFTVDEAVDLVLAALANIDLVKGKVLARQMKAAQIADFLDVWTSHLGGTWERIAGRPGERNDEFLVGDLELEHTRRFSLNDIPHYLIAFNQRVDEPLAETVSSANAERLSKQEILDLVTNPPMEEQ